MTTKKTVRDTGDDLIASPGEPITVDPSAVTDAHMLYKLKGIKDLNS